MPQKVQTISVATASEAGTPRKASWIESSRPEDRDYRGAQYFRRSFRTAKPVRSALLYITAHGMYEAQLNGKRVGDAYLSPGWTSYNKRLPYQVYDVKDELLKGDNALGVVVGNGWYRGFLAWGDNKDIYGKQLGVLCQLSITYADGSTEQVASDGKWLSSDGAIRFCEIYHGETVDAREDKKGWSSPLYNAAGWVPVKAVGHSLGNLVAGENEPVRKHETFRPVKIFTTPKGEQVKIGRAHV